MKFVLLLLILGLHYVICCPNDDHKCDEGSDFKCIAKEWVCDRNEDCNDGSDEINCNFSICPKNQIKCLQSDFCLPKNKFCNGIVDCPDRSDEEFCNHKTDNKTKCNTNEFDCMNYGRLECIPYSAVCNNKMDCKNGRDEQSPCLIKNSCVLKERNCFQKCSNSGDTYKCQCYPGFEFIHDTKCHASRSENEIILFYLSQNRVFSKNLFDTQSSFLLLNYPDYLDFFDVGYDKNDLIIFRTISKNQTVLLMKKWFDCNKPYAKNSSCKVEEMTLVNKFATFFHLSYDDIHRLLFWTDAIKHQIVVMNVTNGDQVSLITKSIYKPYGIKAYNSIRRLFWIDGGKGNMKSRIMMSDYDGTSVTTLIDDGLNKPTSLLYDILTDRLYFIDNYPGSIKFIYISSETRQIYTLIQHNEFEPYDLAIYGDLIYWSDWRQNRIYSAHKIGGHNIRTVVEIYKPTRIQIISQSTGSQRLFDKLYLNYNKKIILTQDHCLNSNVCHYNCLPTKLSFTCFDNSLINHWVVNKHIDESISNKLWFLLIPFVVLLMVIVFINRHNKYVTYVIQLPSRIIGRSSISSVNFSSAKSTSTEVNFWDEDRLANDDNLSDGMVNILSRSIDSSDHDHSDTAPILT